MKVLIASDTHGRLNAVKKLKTIIEKENPEKIILLGDFLYHGPRNGVPTDLNPIEVANLLNSFASKIIAVRGNCDARVDQMLLKFDFPDYQEVELNGYICHLFHGDLLNLFKAKAGDLVISGHTHVPVLHQEGGIVFLNPGSTSFPKGRYPASFALWNDGFIRIKSLEDESVLKEIALPEKE